MCSSRSSSAAHKHDQMPEFTQIDTNLHIHIQASCARCWKSLLLSLSLTHTQIRWPLLLTICLPKQHPIWHTPVPLPAAQKSISSWMTNKQLESFTHSSLTLHLDLCPQHKTLFIVQTGFNFHLFHILVIMLHIDGQKWNNHIFIISSVNADTDVGYFTARVPRVKVNTWTVTARLPADADWVYHSIYIFAYCIYHQLQNSS